MNFFKIFIFVCCLGLGTALWGRAGGGGGGGHSSSHSSSNHSSSSSQSGGYSSSRSSGGYYGSSNDEGGGFFTFLVCIFIFGIIGFVIFTRLKGQAKFQQSISSDPDLNNMMKDDPDFEDLAKAKVAFMTIQKCWSEKRLDLMRRFITDGVYQRFNAQFAMMNLLEQTDVMENVRVSGLSIQNKRIDGNYEVIDIRIEAYAEDQFVSQKYPQLNSPGGGESFVEYWSFIRRNDYKKGFDIYSSEVCPQCSAPLTAKLVETAQCPYCATYLNNGEYDWVLAEITQEDNYSMTAPVKLPVEITASETYMANQVIEDRASNAFMQILMACTLKKEASLVRFTTPQALDSIKKLMLEIDYIYDRFYLESVEVAGIEINNNLCRVTVDINFGYRRVQLKNQTAFLLEADLVSDYRQIILVRELGGAASKGSVYANSCSHCGAAQKDSLSAVCAYCNQPLNNAKTEWLVDQFLE